MNETVLKVLIDFVTVLELDQVVRLKNEAVRQQDFPLAIEWRKKENELRSQLLGVTELGKLRNELLKTLTDKP